MPKRATLSTRSLSTSTATTDQVPKDSGLTGAELDSNFLELRDQTFGVVGDDSSTIDIAAGGTLYIQGGTNCSTTTNSDGSITINTQADQDVFKTISVAGQNDVVADSTTDSLTLVAGNGMTITTDDSTDSITFTSNADIGDLQVTAYGGGSDETFINPGTAASTNANLMLSGKNTGQVIIADDMVVGFTGSTTSNILSVTNDTITHTSAGGTVTDRLILQGGTNMDDQHSAVNLRARTIELNNNTNVTLTARGGDGDFYISNGGIAASNNLGTATVGHNSIVLTDDNDGEITINPKTGKWVEIQGLRFPTADGTSGQVIQTNGSGILSFVDQSGSAINIDGGTAASTYGAITAIDGGDAT